MKLLIITAAFACSVTASSIAFSQESAKGDAREVWAKKVTTCLSDKKYLSGDDKTPGCYITKDFKIWCDGGIPNFDPEIPRQCSTGASQARPERRVAN